MCNIQAKELKAAAGIASKDKSRSILTGVLVEEGEKEYTVTSTDSFMLFSAHRHDHKDGMKRYVIDAEPLKHLKASDEFVNLTPIDDEYIKATIHYGFNASQYRTEIWPLLEGKYPNWEKLIDDDSESAGGEFAVNPDFVATMAKAMKTAAKVKGEKQTRHVKFRCVSPNKPIQLLSGKDYEYLGIVMPIRLS